MIPSLLRSIEILEVLKVWRIRCTVLGGRSMASASSAME